MALQLYGSYFSTCTRRVATILHEKNVPFVLHHIDMAKGEQKLPEFVKKQPFGQIPYIDDDGFILYESRAICYYIATKYAGQGTPLVPTDLKGIALFHQAASIEAFNFNVHAEQAIAEMVYKPFFGVEPDQSVFERHISDLSKQLEGYERILSKQKYLAGDEITLVDLYHLPHGSTLEKLSSEVIASKPNVARWFKDITSRTSWQTVKDVVKSTA